MHKPFKPMIALAALVAMTFAQPAPAAAPKILEAVPPGAPMVITVPSLNGLAAKLSMLNRELGLEMPQLDNPIQMLKQTTQMMHGIDDDGGVALVITSLVGEFGPMPRGVLLVPIKDFGQFGTNFQKIEKADLPGVSKVEFQQMPLFIRQIGPYAIVGQDEQSVADFKAPKKDARLTGRVGKLGRSVIDGADLIMTVDFEALRPTIKPFLEQGVLEMMAEMDNDPQAKAFKPVAKLIMDGIKAMVADTDVAAMSITMTKDGFNIAGSVQFKEGSDLAKAFGTKPKPLALDRLPNKPFTLVTSMDLSTLPIGNWLDKFTAAMPKDHEATAFVQPIVTAMKMGMSSPTQTIMLTPKAGGAPTMGFDQVSVITTDKPKEMVAAYRQMMTKLGEIKIPEGAGEIKVTYQENAKQVNGVSADRYTVQTILPPEVMQQMGPMAVLLGVAQPQTGYIATTKDAVISTQGLDETILGPAVAAAGGNGQLGASPAIVKARQHLMDDRVIEAYVDVLPFLQMANAMAQMLAPQFAFEMPEKMPLIAYSISASEGGMGERVFVPMPMIKTFVTIGKKMMNQQLQPQGGRRPGQV